MPDQLTMMPKLTLRNQSIKEEMEKPWAEELVGNHLGNVLAWVRMGYRLNDRQVRQLDEIAVIVKEE